MQLHDILQLRTSVILPEAISDGDWLPPLILGLFLTTYRGGSHLPSVYINILEYENYNSYMEILYTFENYSISTA